MQKRIKNLSFKTAVKKNLTLIEVLVSFFLACMVTMFLIGTYVHFAKIRATLHERSFVSLQKERTYELLNLMFYSMAAKNGDFSPIYTEKSAKTTLVLNHKNMIDIDPKFCGEVLSKIYIKEEKLFIETNSLAQTDSRKILLLENIKTVAFDFYDANAKKWLHEWGKESQSQPCFVKITITDKKSCKTTFVFNTPNSHLDL